jgi:cation transport ATPase
MCVVRQKLFLGFLLNAAGITLGVTDLLNPLFAAGAGFLSIFVVVGHALRRNPS